LHARAALARLFDRRPAKEQLTAARAELSAARLQPAEVTRVRRLGHLALQATPLSFLMSLLFTVALVMPVAQVCLLEFDARISEGCGDVLRERGGEEYRRAAASPDPVVQAEARVAWRADEFMAEELKAAAQACRTRRAVRRRAMSVLTRTVADYLEPMYEIRTQPIVVNERQKLQDASIERVRWEGCWHLYNTGYRPQGAGWLVPNADFGPTNQQSTRFRIQLGEWFILFWFVLCVVWAALFRGGVTLWAAGLALVRADGRSAGRFRCLSRALVVWLPVAALLLLGMEGEQWYWRAADQGPTSRWLLWLAGAAWWGSWGLLLLYVPLAVIWPRRGAHDWLAGTYLVPR
jgi:hypothetical protein